MLFGAKENIAEISQKKKKTTFFFIHYVCIHKPDGCPTSFTSNITFTNVMKSVNNNESCFANCKFTQYDNFSPNSTFFLTFLYFCE